MNLADFEKYDAALGRDEVDHIERLMIEQINLYDGTETRVSETLSHAPSCRSQSHALDERAREFFSVNLLSRFCPCPFFRNFGSVLNSSQFRILSQRSI